MQDYLTTPPRLDARGPAPRSVADRFWEKVKKSDSCWLWTGPRDQNGYGCLTVGSVVDGTRRREKAHRISWVLHYGDIPDDREVCHNCPGQDNPSCVNPAHLFLGTHQQNMADAARKGRIGVLPPPKGVVLTLDAIREIRRLYAAGGVSQRELGLKFGIGQEHVSLIVHRKIWKRI